MTAWFIKDGKRLKLSAKNFAAKGFAWGVVMDNYMPLADVAQDFPSRDAAMAKADEIMLRDGWERLP